MFCRGTEYGVWRGGRLGDSFLDGRPGPAVLAGLVVPTSPLLTGGLGRLSVRRPVVSALYGPDGGFSSSSSSTRCCLREGVGTGDPSPPDGAAIAPAPPPKPPAPVCFGGGPNESGSFKLDKGADVWLCAYSYGSFFFPVAIPFRSDFHESRCMGASPAGFHPPFAMPLKRSIPAIGSRQYDKVWNEKRFAGEVAGLSASLCR